MTQEKHKKPTGGSSDKNNTKRKCQNASAPPAANEPTTATRSNSTDPTSVNTIEQEPQQSRKASVIDVDDDDDAASSVDSQAEASEAELGTHMNIETLPKLIGVLERLSKKWSAPVYAFFKPMPTIGYEQGRRYHQFHCFKSGCQAKIRRYLDGKDASSTSNLRKHARSCWGADIVSEANNAKNAEEARQKVTGPVARIGSIDAAFERTGKGKITWLGTDASGNSD